MTTILSGRKYKTGVWVVSWMVGGRIINGGWAERWNAGWKNERTKDEGVHFTLGCFLGCLQPGDGGSEDGGGGWCSKW
jgi:hypothetical protein